MRFCTPKLLLPLLLLSAVAGYAENTFDFSYRFAADPKDKLGGTITGTWNGDVVKLTSLQSFWLTDSTQTISASVLGGYDPSSSWWTADPVLSPNLFLNNFALTDPDGFLLFQFSVAPDDVGALSAVWQDLTGTTESDFLGTVDQPSQTRGTWTFTERNTSSVPDGGSTAVMLVVSCAALGLLRRRRR